MTAITNITTLYRDREALPLRTRLLFTFGAVAALHAAAVVLLLAGNAAGSGAEPLIWGLVLGGLSLIPATCPGAVDGGRCGVDDGATYVMLGMLWVAVVAIGAMPPVWLVLAGRRLFRFARRYL